MVAKTTIEGIEGQAYTTVHIILAEIYRGLDCCKHGARYFGRRNLLLQIWLIEYFQNGDYGQELFCRPLGDYSQPSSETNDFTPERFFKPTNARGQTRLFNNLSNEQV